MHARAGALAPDATQTPRSRARRRGSRRAAPVGPCARRGRALGRDRRADGGPASSRARRSRSIPARPLHAAVVADDGTRRGARPARADDLDGRLDGAAAGRAASALAALGLGLGRTGRHRLGHRRRQRPNVYAVDVGSTDRAALCTSQRAASSFWSSDDGGATLRRRRFRSVVRARNTSEAIEPAIAVDRTPAEPRLRRLHRARLGDSAAARARPTSSRILTRPTADNGGTLVAARAARLAVRPRRRALPQPVGRRPARTAA